MNFMVQSVFSNFGLGLFIKQSEIHNPKSISHQRYDMNKRQAVRAGMFYPALANQCQAQARALLEGVALPADTLANIRGGLLPHAGWAYSGALAAMTVRALMASLGGQPGTVVIFGADHTGQAQLGEVWDAGAWETPLGDVEIDEALARALLGSCGLLRSNPQAHLGEHSIEVQLPLLRQACPALRIVPIAVPPREIAVEIGRAVGAVLAGLPNARVLGSSDLTHHGGQFGNPGGRGEKSELFARQNDQRILELIEQLDAEAIVPEADLHSSACGAGAIAATIAAVREMV